MIPQETVNRILDSAQIVDVIGDFVTLKKRGANYLACCPFHNEKTPSFSVSPSKGIYKCFGCGKSGTAVGFVMEHESLSYVEALKYLARKYHIEVVEKEESAEEIAQRQRNESLLLVSEYAGTKVKLDGEEYIIVHEANAKNPVTLKNYLYALNADGNFSGHKLSKSETDVVKGYDGMIGHPISYYTLEHDEETGEDILFLEEPELDDVEAVRWRLTKNSNGSYSMKTAETYFANNDSLYIDGKTISMMPSNSSYLLNMNIAQLEDNSGYFYISNAGNYFLWCNDGVNENYNAKANAYYTANASNPIFHDVTETPGTFHCDALNATGSNILGGQIDTSDDDPNIQYEDGAFQIYRRVVDEVSSTYESRVYTDLQATLQEDGTYDVTLETYAISPNHYQYVGEKPTDYIIVADTSSSMASKGSTGIFVSHNMDDVALVADRVIVMNDGKVALDGTPTEVFSNSEYLYSRSYKTYLHLQKQKANPSSRCSSISFRKNTRLGGSQVRR